MQMRLSEFADMPVIDCHVHFGSFGAGKVKLAHKELEKLGEFMVGVIKKGRLSQMYVTARDAGLYLKRKYGSLFYAGGFTPWSRETDTLVDVDWPSYIGQLVKVGFDGIGEMGSKTAPRDRHTPLDGDYYRGFWESCESLDFPVLCHVADPEEFWDQDLAPDWAKERGWLYVGDYPTKEELYTEMENVLAAYPDLNVVLCHFYFMSADLERASDLLDRYTNANLDLTLGIELMYNISRRRDDWRNFFVKYQDRIFFGTDIATWQTLQQAIDRIWLIRNFLESDEEFLTPSTADRLLTRYEQPFIGLKLPEAVLRRIYSENFERLWGKRPKEVCLDASIEMLEEKGEEVMAKALRSFL